MTDSVATFAEALGAVEGFRVTPVPVRLPLEEAYGLVVTGDVRSKVSLPPSAVSAMDGYGLACSDTTGASDESPVTLRVAGASYAGGKAPAKPKPQKAVRIATGAPLPEGCDGVVRQEDVTLSGDDITLTRPVEPGENVRHRGEDVTEGDRAVQGGVRLNPFITARLASIGETEVEVFRPPAAGVLSTGSELVPPGEPLEEGRIYSSNGQMLTAALRLTGARDVIARTVPDDETLVKEALSELHESCDIVLVSGGVSVGDYDLVVPALSSLGYKTLFHGVNQKPGRPLYFGSRAGKPLFGLPGNPVPAALCFFLYAYPLVRRWMGLADCALPRTRGVTSAGLREKEGRVNIVRGIARYDRDITFTPAPRQGSHIISSLTDCNALAFVEGPLEDGDEVEIALLPWNELCSH